jgi:hypothetical protein
LQKNAATPCENTVFVIGIRFLPQQQGNPHAVFDLLWQGMVAAETTRFAELPDSEHTLRVSGLAILGGGCFRAGARDFFCGLAYAVPPVFDCGSSFSP